MCPRCGLPVYTPRVNRYRDEYFCENCGWNRDVLRHALIGLLVQRAYDLGIFMLVFVLISTRKELGQFSDINISIAAVLSILLINVLIAIGPAWKQWKTLKQLRQLPPDPDTAAPNSIPPAPETFRILLPAANQVGTIFAGLAGLSRPRSVRLGLRGRVWLGIAASASVLLLVLYDLTTGDTFLHRILLVLVAVIVTRMGFVLRREIRAKRLLSEGEETLGRVISPGLLSRYYAFMDSAQRGYLVRGSNIPYGIAAGAPIQVFYDPSDPKKNIVPEASWWEIKGSAPVEERPAGAVGGLPRLS